ncbi:MAG: hypothetical protein EP330_26190 [Deltaproteobacteria bacterium]|nr:MAG: hypothetical protein EP330_26190 [Deltaproteobacteria bacterium]
MRADAGRVGRHPGPHRGHAGPAAHGPRLCARGARAARPARRVQPARRAGQHLLPVRLRRDRRVLGQGPGGHGGRRWRWHRPRRAR